MLQQSPFPSNTHDADQDVRAADQAAQAAQARADYLDDPEAITCFGLDDCVEDADAFDLWGDDLLCALNGAADFSTRENMILKLVRMHAPDSAQ
jgi:hypothetical protein